jgi:Asparagine synthase
LTAPEHDFVRLSPVETQLGFPFEARSGAPTVVRRSPDRRSARAVLEDILRDALADGPCYVTFSGGRDSSALLALAVHLARRDGLPLPVPVTAVYPEAPATDESYWQQLVLDHLGVGDQVVVAVGGQQRLLSESATVALRSHGVLWPEATQLQGPLLRGLHAGGALVTGEGGDNAIAGGRVAPLRMLMRTWPPRRSIVRGAVRSMRDRQPAFVPGWFTAAAAEVFRTRVVEHREALRWDVRTRQILDQPAAQVLFANVKASIAECRLRPFLPFVDPQFLAALSREGGPLGFGGRGLVFEHLVGDVLPREVVFRSSKASFNETRWGDDEREFAREWDGTGFDSDWVDADILRAEWLSADPHPVADFHLHVAWAAHHGITPVDSAQRVAAEHRGT